MKSKRVDTARYASDQDPETSTARAGKSSEAAIFRRRRMAQVASSIAALTPGNTEQTDSVDMLQDDRAR